MPDGLLLHAAYLTQQRAAVPGHGDGPVVRTGQRHDRSDGGGRGGDSGGGAQGRLRGRGTVRAVRLHLVPPCIDVWHDGLPNDRRGTQ